MTKLIGFLIVAVVSMSVFARTCPPPRSIYYQNIKGQFIVDAPSGWRLVEDSRQSKYARATDFGLAAWGDHRSLVDNIRCYYYSYSTGLRGSVELETIELLDESHVLSWRDSTKLYDLCASKTNNVNDCTFN